MNIYLNQFIRKTISILNDFTNILNNLPHITMQIIRDIDEYKFKPSTEKGKTKFTCTKESLKVFLYYYIKTYCFIDNNITIINNFKNNIYKLLAKCIPEHTLEITSFNTKTNKIHTLFPLLCLFKYYRIPRRLHEVYYSITIWSSKDNKYISLFIDALILSELENKYILQPYSITNILELLKYTNTIKYIDIYY